VRVLVVDDEADMRLLLELALRRWGQQVTAVGDLVEARRICAEDPPDLLLIDVTMPGTDGVTFLASLQDAGLAPRQSYLMSALPEDELSAIASGLGVGWLPKPLGVAELRDRLGPLLDDGGSDA
jgi:DNA-binding response OmpR family regulator